MIFTGATSSVRGGGWLAFSSAKFALRGLVQSLARELWPQGAHVAHLVVDGIIGPAGVAAVGGEPKLDPNHMPGRWNWICFRNMKNSSSDPKGRLAICPKLEGDLCTLYTFLNAHPAHRRRKEDVRVYPQGTR